MHYYEPVRHVMDLNEQDSRLLTEEECTSFYLVEVMSASAELRTMCPGNEGCLSPSPDLQQHCVL